MTDKQIKSAISNCYWRDDGFKGNDKSDRYVICRGYCEPCLKVIDSGKCDTLIELFKAENEQVGNPDRLEAVSEWTIM